MAYAMPQNQAIRLLTSTMFRASRLPRSTLEADMAHGYREQTVDRIVADCYFEFSRDWLGFWQIATSVEAAHPAAGWQDIRERTLEVVRRLLVDPRVHAGRPSTTITGGFDPWPLRDC